AAPSTATAIHAATATGETLSPRARLKDMAPIRRYRSTVALLTECLEELSGVPEVVLSDPMGRLKAGAGTKWCGARPAVHCLRSTVRFPPSLLWGWCPGVQAAGQLTVARVSMEWGCLHDGRQSTTPPSSARSPRSDRTLTREQCRNNAPNGSDLLTTCDSHC